MSEPTRLFPYFFPTTVVFVDDNPKFLRSLALELPEDLAYQTFENAEAALERINRSPSVPPLYQRCFSQYGGGSGEQLIHLDLSQIELEISNTERFREVSVVVVDFDMPVMDGLELCRRITNPRIRKVLFTGVADEKIAVQAFNAGIIDRFIIKSQPDAVEAVRSAVLELQQRYFEAISETLRATLMLNPPPFLTDPAVERLFSELRGEHKLVEYYLVANPGGFLSLTDEGELYRLVVLSEAELAAQADWAAAQGAPEEIVRALREHRRLGYFYETPDAFYDSADYAWDEYLVPARRLDGEGTWYFALIASPPVDIDFDDEAAHYNAYLDRLDSDAA